eukprot:TRINITY_DN3000_c0_g1_i1.p1 TRINITY_DN3000_c0_g1~~TRINITY_DN3000_c0_g1_i1.p1  ORF type:complete len:821 (+),score=236.62 TRINITY_DN3000_c0_g1_i1:42-2465(+)
MSASIHHGRGTTRRTPTPTLSEEMVSLTSADNNSNNDDDDNNNNNNDNYNDDDGRSKASDMSASIALQEQWEDPYVDHLSLFQAATHVADAVHEHKFDHDSDLASLTTYRVFTSKYYTYFVRLVAVLNLANALFEPPALWPLPAAAYLSIEFFTFAIFAVDAYVRVKFLKPGYYMKDQKNLLHLGIILLQILDAIVWVVLNQVMGLGYPRWTRLLRPLYIVYFFKHVRVALRDIRKTVPQVLEVFALLAFLLCFYTVFCWVFYFGTEQGDIYFNDLVNTFTLLYVCVTTANFPDVFMPAYTKSLTAPLIFIPFMILGTYLFFNLLLAVIYNFYRLHMEKEVLRIVARQRDHLRDAFVILDPGRTGYVTYGTFHSMYKIFKPSKSDAFIHVVFKILDMNKEGRVNFREFLRIVDVYHLNIKEFKRKVTLKDQYRTVRWFPALERVYMSTTYLQFKGFITSTWFGYLMDTFVGISAVAIVVAFACLKEEGSLSRQVILQNVQEVSPLLYTFFIIFVAEMLIKIAFMGWTAYWQLAWHKFDVCIIVIGFLDLFMDDFVEDTALGIQVLRVFLLCRVIRVVRIFGKIERFKILLGTIFSLLPVLIIYGGVLLCFYYFYSILGMMIWGGLIYPSNPLLVGTDYATANYYQNSFNDIYRSFVLCFELMVVNNWQVLVSGFVAVSNRGAWLFFIVFNMTVVLVAINIVVAFTLDVFAMQWDLYQQKEPGALQQRILDLDEIVEEDTLNFDDDQWRDPASAEMAACTFVAEPKASEKRLIRRLFAAEIAEADEKAVESLQSMWQAGTHAPAASPE